MVSCLLFAALRLSAGAQYDVTLAWDPSLDSTVVGYRLYYGSASATYTNLIDVGSTTAATASNLVAGVTYIFAVTAYDADGVESLPSNEVRYTVPLPDPVQPVITNCHTLPDGNFILSVTGEVGQTVVLFSASNLVTPIQWLPIATNTTDTNGLLDCRDLQATNYPQRYYRIQAN